ncbi:hypothetical protein J5X92_08915 [Alteromonas sp. K632G]|jgi:hypothetical protein|uniref:hypothetical protein n=1 Tax=Alteromonas sp. K632G TaxID=2820757 RepID=UPI001AD64A45|nr:hypothetical protein [Alteromonas sp. K632G]MBO7922333.1 hypothetical protein [Alteromonas sp. K632G]|tara:strand:- start:14545 stop:15459 length:915 start_codon:yes stop_codon:yes gene_type:complete
MTWLNLIVIFNPYIILWLSRAQLRINSKKYKWGANLATIAFSAFFAVSCSAATQVTESMEEAGKPEQALHKQIEQTAPKSTSDDFADIQKALQALDNSLAPTTQKNTSREAYSQPSSTSGEPSNTIKPAMGMGKNSMTMMSKSNQSCMGMMCKMKMKNSSMMGMPQKIPPVVTDTNTLITLPGKSDALHLYHLGEDSFFMNFKDALFLSDEQLNLLVNIQDKWQTFQVSHTEKRSRLESSLWTLTSKGLPNFSDIKSTISAIEIINSELRTQFIVLVGEAVSVLTPSQLSQIEALWHKQKGLSQ